VPPKIVPLCARFEIVREALKARELEQLPLRFKKILFIDDYVS
jgi:hypothetical protein